MVKRVVAVGCLGAALAALLVGLFARRASSVTFFQGTPYVRSFERPSGSLEIMLAGGDGQAFAALARDPLLSRPEAFREGKDAAAYRAQRPLLGYLAWIVSLGDPARVPAALAALTILGAGLASGAGAMILERRGSLPTLALGWVALPGSIAALQWLGPEPLGMAAAAAGISSMSSRRAGAARGAGWFTVATLARETYLLVPLGVAIRHLRRRRYRRGLTLLLVPALVFGAWLVVVRVRYGAWPLAGAGGTLAFPLLGILDRATSWNAIDWTIALAVAAVTILLLLTRRSDPLAPVAVGYAALAVVMGPGAWSRWEDFSRPLLPLFALGAVALIRAGREPEADP